VAAREGVVMSLLPEGLSMVVARQVATDDATGEALLVGVVHALTFKSFPAIQPQLVAWAELTGGRGVMPLLLTLLMLREGADEQVMTTLRLQANFSDPRRIHVVKVFLDGIPIPAPCELLFRLGGERTVIIERRVSVRLQEDG
jgi:hypothetical protein